MLEDLHIGILWFARNSSGCYSCNYLQPTDLISEIGQADVAIGVHVCLTSYWNGGVEGVPETHRFVLSINGDRL